MKAYRAKPVDVMAEQFTREMAEGSVPLPDGVIMASRSRGANGKLDFAGKFDPAQ